MSQAEQMQYKPGDRVRHDSRPEWGVGRVQRVEETAVGGKATQRLFIKFPNAGLKTLAATGATLSRVEGDILNGADDGATLLEREAAHEGGWLGQISKSKPEDAMAELPLEATDPFRPLEARLRHTFGLYRFSREGASLIDWAVARSGLDDPLSRFNRHELEQFFERWAFLRDKHLASLLKDAHGEGPMVKRLLADAPPAAKRAVQRCNAAR